MNQLAAMRTFVRVVERGSFSGAADDLDISRAVASAQVQALERHLGVRLLTRTTRRVALTPDGTDYYQSCGRILQELQAADDRMRRTRERVQGRLRVDVPAMFGRHLLVPALPGFMARYPELALEIQYNDRIVDLTAERIDVAVRFSRNRTDRFVVRRIGSTRLVACASPTYLREQGVPASPEDLRRHRLIGRQPPASRRRDWTFRYGTQVRRLALPCSVTFDTVEGCLQAAVSGLGIFQTADIVAAPLIRSGRLQSVLDAWEAEGPPVSVVYDPVNRSSAKVRVFVDFVSELFRSAVERQPGARGT